MRTVTTPQDVSKEAEVFYSQEIPEAPMIDFNSVADIQFIREYIHPIWQHHSDSIPFNFSFEEITINNITCYQIDPPSITSDDHIILYIHGGSNFLGHPTLCKNIPVSIAHECGLRVISINYRLAPEHKFPIPHEDILAVINGLKEHYGNQVQYALLGHSSGGGLALSTALLARDKQILQPLALALLAPWVDMELTGDTIHSLETVDPNPPTYAWFYESAKAFLGNYKRNDPLVSPLYANFSGLCKTYIQLAGRDRFCSDGFRLNRRLLEAKIACSLDIFDGMWHGFQIVPSLPEARAANKATADFLKTSLFSNNS